MRILREYEELLEKIDKGEVKENDSERLIKLQGKIDALNLWDMESEAKNVLTKLGITNFEEKVGKSFRRTKEENNACSCLNNSL